MKIKRLVALLLVSVMLLSFTACKKESLNVNDMVTMPGTLFASFNWAREDLATKNNYTKEEVNEENKNKFIDIATNNFGIAEDKANAFWEDRNIWTVYTVDIELHNNSSTSKTFVGFTVSGLPEGIWNDGNVGYEFTLPSNVTDELYQATFIVDTTKVDKIAMYNAFSKMKLELIYFETPEDGTEEVPESEYKKFLVTNNLVAPEPDAQDETQISAKRVGIQDDYGTLDSLINNPAAFNNEAKHFGLDSDTVSNIIADGVAWECYIIKIEVENKTTTNLNIYAIVAENNGSNGVWVSSVSQFGEEYGMPANGKQTLPVNVLVNTAALGGKSTEEAINAIKLQLEYFVGDYEDMGDEDAAVKNFITVK